MPLQLQLLTQTVGVRTQSLTHDRPRVLTQEIAAEASLFSLLPRLMTQAVGVKTLGLMATESLEPLTQSVGVSASLIWTMPVDTRTNWVEAVEEADDHCKEITPLVRTKQVKLSEYGRLTIYGRQFTIPRGNRGQAVLETVLAHGAHMRAVWADEWFSLDLDGPKLADVSVGQYVKDRQATGLDVAQATFIAIRTLGPVASSAYNATARTLVGQDALGETWVEWGIAPSLAASGIPAPGSVMTGFSGVYAPKCQAVQANDMALPGRWLIKSTYRRRLANPFILKPVAVEDVFTQSGVVSIRERTVSKTATAERKHSIGAIMG